LSTVDKIEVRSGRGLPDTITLTNKTLNRSINIRNVAGAMNKFTLIDAGQLGIYDHTRNAKANIKLSDGTYKELPVEVHWHDADLSLVETAPIEISIFGFIDFFYKLILEQCFRRFLAFHFCSCSIAVRYMPITSHRS